MKRIIHIDQNGKVSDQGDLSGFGAFDMIWETCFLEGHPEEYYIQDTDRDMLVPVLRLKPLLVERGYYG